MNPVIENFLERPTSHKVAFWVLSLLIMLGITWQYVLSGPFEEREEVRTKIEDMEIKILEQQRIARDLPKFREEVEYFDKKLELALLELPDKKEISDLLTSISVLAIDTGLEVVKFSPNREALQDFYATVPVSIELEGTFHQLATFFDEVGRLSRIVNVDNITIDIITESKSEVVIRASCQATTFRYLTDEERERTQKASKGKSEKKKRKIR
jgi:type IV pilus assembly protein PilO